MVVSRMVKFSFNALQLFVGSVICERNTAALSFLNQILAFTGGVLSHPESYSITIY